MRVALLHNATAGSEDHTDEEIIRELRRTGHEVPHVSRSVGQLQAALQREPCDLVLVAGGDGTVSRTACKLAGWGIPLSILPLGTANNTAESLAVPKRVKDVAKGWRRPQRRQLDLGLLDDGAIRQRFAEAAGWGVFPSSIELAKRQGDAGSVRRTLKRNRRLFGKRARETPAREYLIEIDGRDVSGRYVLVEVLNVPRIGPKLCLSPGSDPGDGLLEVVLAGEAQRGALWSLARDEQASDRLPVERGACVSVTASDGLMHLDGKLQRHPESPRRFEITVQPRTVEYVVSGFANRR